MHSFLFIIIDKIEAERYQKDSKVNPKVEKQEPDKQGRTGVVASKQGGTAWVSLPMPPTCKLSLTTVRMRMRVIAKWATCTQTTAGAVKKPDVLYGLTVQACSFISVNKKANTASCSIFFKSPNETLNSKHRKKKSPVVLVAFDMYKNSQGMKNTLLQWKYIYTKNH